MERFYPLRQILPKSMYVIEQTLQEIGEENEGEENEMENEREQMVWATVCFHQEAEVPDELLQFAVIAARAEGKWIFCRHKERNTYEIPGGHRETGEAIADTARRELYEETGALEFKLWAVCIYSVAKDDQITYGKLFCAEVQKFGELPEDFEIGEVVFADTLPQALTYPAIQPYLLKRASDFVYWRD